MSDDKVLVSRKNLNAMLDDPRLVLHMKSEHVRALMDAIAQPSDGALAPEPFFYALCGPDGKPHYQECCVSGEAHHLEPDADGVTVIPVYRHPSEARGQEPTYLFRRKGHKDWCTCDKERYSALAIHDLFEVDLLYRRPVPPAPAAFGKYDEVLKPFLAMMEIELHANAAKGDRPGWLSMSAEQCLLEIYYHVSKLQKAVRDGNGDRIKENTADVANMTMMLADICGALEIAQPSDGALANDGDEPVPLNDAFESWFRRCPYEQVTYSTLGYMAFKAGALWLSTQRPPAPASLVPEGWKLVPVEPTDDMIVAFAEAWYSKRQAIDDPDMLDAYAGMLAAAPASTESRS